MPLEHLAQQLADAERRRDPDAQIEVLRQFLSIAQQSGNTVLEISTLRGLGNAYQAKDELSRAHSFRVTASQLTDDPRSECPPELKMAVECDLGRSYIEARDWPRAKTHTQRAIDLARSLDRQREHCIFQLNLGVILAATGQLEEAHDLAEEVQQLGEELQDHYILGLVHCNQATWLLEQTRLNGCQRHARQALIHAGHSGDAQIRMRVEKILGESFRIGRLATGRREYSVDAERHLQEAVQEARSADNPSREYEAVVELARLCEDLGRLDEAAEHRRQALQTLERVRGSLGYDEFQLTFFEALQPAYQSATEFFLRHNQPHEAFQTAERLRGRLLLAQLGPERSSPGAWSSDRREELNAILDQFGHEVLEQCQQRVAGLVRDMTVGVHKKADLASSQDVAFPPPAAVDEESNSDQPLLSAARQRFISFYEAQRLNRAVWRPQPFPPIVSLNDMQRVLGENDALIVYYETGSTLAIFVATDQATHFQQLAYSSRRLADDVAKVCATMSALQDQVLDTGDWFARGPQDPWPGPIAETMTQLHHGLEKLFALLVAPILAVVDRKPHWVIVPHGPLHCLPWSALRGCGRYLIERHSISLLPSASLGAILQSRTDPAAEAAIFLADPDPHDLSLRLPGARREVEAAYRLFRTGLPPLVGAAATKNAFLEHASTAGLLHLACHHFFDARAPLLSFLKLAGTSGADFLYAFEITGMALPAELVVLSACQSGRSQIATGDEQMGIVRAFLAAGTGSIISTLWSIEDESAATLFADFYRHACKLGLAQALATAQRHLLADPRFALPYFWAPYHLTGRWNKPLGLPGLPPHVQKA